MNKRVIICGTGNIGQAVAAHLASRGTEVVMVHAPEPKLAEVPMRYTSRGGYNTTPALKPLLDSADSVTYVTTKPVENTDAARAKILAAAEKWARKDAAKLKRHPHLIKAPR